MSYLFIAARNYTPGPRTKGAIRLIVLHDMESPETVHTAEDCAFYFAGPNAPQASCHYMVDSDSIVQGVHDWDIAWHCPGANHDGIGIEHAGYARQTRDEWLDPYGLAMLRLSAELVVELCDAYGLPVAWLGPDEVAAGAYGITTHRACTQAFGTVGGHTDPGENFPDDVYLRMVVDAVEKRRNPVPEEDDDVNCEVRYGFEPSWAKAVGSPIAGRFPEVEVDAREGALRGYNGVAFVVAGSTDRSLTDGDPASGLPTAVDISAGRLNGGPVRFTIRDGDTVTFVTQGGGRYSLTAVAP